MEVLTVTVVAALLCFALSNFISIVSQKQMLEVGAVMGVVGLVAGVGWLLLVF